MAIDDGLATFREVYTMISAFRADGCGKMDPMDSYLQRVNQNVVPAELAFQGPDDHFNTRRAAALYKLIKGELECGCLSYRAASKVLNSTGIPFKSRLMPENVFIPDYSKVVGYIGLRDS